MLLILTSPTKILPPLDIYHFFKLSNIFHLKKLKFITNFHIQNYSLYATYNCKLIKFVSLVKGMMQG